LCFYKLGYYKDAILNFEKVLEINCKYINAYRGIGMVYEAEKKFEKARHYFDEALKIDNTFSRALLNKGFTYF